MDEKDKKKLLGLIIKRERKKRGIAQDKLAALIDLDSTNLSRIEKGKSSPSFDTLCNVIEALRIEPNELLGFLKYEENIKDDSDILIQEYTKTLPCDIKEGIVQFLKVFIKKQ